MQNKKRRSEIFKVQLSLQTTAPKPTILIYNKDRSIYWEGEADKQIKNWLMQAEELGYGTRHKAYFKGKLIKTKVILSTLADEQDW